MWPTFDLVNRGEFIELGSPRLIGGVLGTEGVQNGVSSSVYEGKRQEKKKVKKKKGGDERKEKEREEEKKKEVKEKDKGFSRFGWECSLSF